MVALQWGTNIGYDKPAGYWHIELRRQLTDRDSGDTRFRLDLFNVMRKV